MDADQIKRVIRDNVAIWFDGRSLVGVSKATTAILDLVAQERDAAVAAERERCARVADSRTVLPADCEYGHTEWDTNAFVCRLERRGDCLCAVRAEEAEALAAAIRQT